MITKSKRKSLIPASMRSMVLTTAQREVAAALTAACNLGLEWKDTDIVRGRVPGRMDIIRWIVSMMMDGGFGEDMLWRDVTNEYNEWNRTMRSKSAGELFYAEEEVLWVLKNVY